MEKNSIIRQLQAEALNPGIQIADLLRKLLVVTRKLKLVEYERWVQHELYGYGDAEPSAYRIIYTHVRARNFHGQWIPVVFRNDAAAASFARLLVREPVAKLQYLVAQGDDEEFLTVPFGSEALRLLMREDPDGPVPERHLNVAQFVGILDAVRNRVLEIALALEERGVLGDGLSFSKAETNRAASISVNLFTGPVNMRDNYTAGQAGAVGPNSNVRSSHAD